MPVAAGEQRRAPVAQPAARLEQHATRGGYPSEQTPGFRRCAARATTYFHPMLTILRRMNAIWVASGRSFGQTSWQASSDMQPNTPSSSPITS